MRPAGKAADIAELAASQEDSHTNTSFPQQQIQEILPLVGCAWSCLRHRESQTHSQ